MKLSDVLHSRLQPLVGTLLLAAVGCSGTAAGPKASSKSARVAKTEATRGPVHAVVEVSPQPARLSDEPTLTLTIDYESGVVIDKPPFGDALGDFIVRDFREPLPAVKNHREIIQQIYTLEPTRTGSLEIDPIAITFTDRRPQGDGARHVFETEALAVQVVSGVASDTPSLDDLDPFAPPVELPASYSWLVWLAAAGMVLLPMAGAGVWWWHRSNAIVAEAVTPDEMARRELERLWQKRLGERDVKMFYLELTGIVRRYIEGTTGVRAPEQTTEEFLREIGGGRSFERAERQRLKDFLESADLVKFAGYRPVAEDIDQAYRRARRFVGLDLGEEVAA